MRKKHQEVLHNLSGAGIQVTAGGQALEGFLALTDTHNQMATWHISSDTESYLLTIRHGSTALGA
jgi:hypothetical protein